MRLFSGCSRSLPFSGLGRLLVFCGILFTPKLHAQLPDPRLTVVTPAGARKGETVSLVVTGTNLAAAELRFSNSQISAVVDEKDPLKFSVTVPASVPPGLYEVRAAGKHGVSNSRRFEVSALPEVAASEKANKPEDSQELALPCIVYGSMKRDRMLWFKVSGVKGRPLVADCRASVLDSKMEALLVLRDADGRELARSRGKPLTWTPAADAPLFLTLRDFITAGGPEYFYRLHVGSPAEVPPLQLRAPLLPWPLPPASTPEKEPNDPAHATKLALPAQIQGEFYPERDADAFEFDAKKGEPIWMEVVSHRAGAPTHARLVIEPVLKDKAAGVALPEPVVIDEAPFFLGDVDFNGEHFDPIGSFTPKEDGTYRVVLRDINNGSVPSHDRRYVLSLRKASPDFALVCAALLPTPNTQFKGTSGSLLQVRGTGILPGQVFALRVLALRKDGFDGAIELCADKLPPGVVVEPSVIGPGQSEGVLLIKVAADAKPWAGAIRLFGTADVGGAALKHEMRMRIPLWEVTGAELIDAPRVRFSEEIVLAILENPVCPTLLQAGAGPVEGTVGDKVKIPVSFQRSTAEQAPLKVKPIGIVGVEKLKEIDIPGTGGKVEYELDLAPLKLVPGNYSVCFRGTDKLKYEANGKPAEAPVVIYSNPVLLKLKEAPSKK